MMDAGTIRPVGATALFAGLLTDLAERVSASVVEVQTARHGGGAGTIWRSTGTIVTNHHVAPRDHADVRLLDGRVFPARVVRRDPENDLAVLEIDAAGLPAVRVGDARALRAGNLVLAVGHPFGVRGAVTAGIVSAALPRDAARDGRELIRADVALGPGNSGGPLVDSRGCVVGLNAMVSGGMALAVPSHLVEALLAVEGARPTLGVAVRDVEIALPVAGAGPRRTQRGVLVVGLASGGAATRAGALVGDVLVRLGDLTVADSEGLLRALRGSVGDTTTLGLLRGGEPLEIVMQFAGARLQQAA